MLALVAKTNQQHRKALHTIVLGEEQLGTCAPRKNEF